MNRLVCAAPIAGIVLVLSGASAGAASCASDIAQFEDVVRHSENIGAFGPTAPQSIDAQLGRQPTAASVMRAERQAQTEFNATLARAEKLAAQGNAAECMRALREAKLMFDAQ